MRPLLFCYCLIGSILALGNPPSQKRTKHGGSSTLFKKHKIVQLEKVVGGKAFLIQSSLPNLEEQLDLRSFLTHDVRGRELLYYLLHTRTNQPVYFALSKTPATHKGHREFALKRSLITQYIQQGHNSNLTTGLSDWDQPDENQREINVKELPADEVLVVIISNGPETTAAGGSLKEDVILKTDPVSKNLFSILLDSEFLRGGPRYTHQTL